MHRADIAGVLRVMQDLNEQAVLFGCPTGLRIAFLRSMDFAG